MAIQIQHQAPQWLGNFQRDNHFFSRNYNEFGSRFLDIKYEKCPISQLKLEVICKLGAGFRALPGTHLGAHLHISELNQIGIAFLHSRMKSNPVLPLGFVRGKAYICFGRQIPRIPPVLICIVIRVTGDSM